MQYRHSSSLWRSWAIQRRVIGALLIRESLTRYGRHNIGFLWLFLEPMMFTVGVTALWTFSGAGHGSNLPIAAFAVTGYSSVLLWRNMPGRTIGGLGPNMSLMYHRNVRAIDIFLARLTLEVLGATMSFIVLSLLFTFIGWMSLPEDILKVLFGWFMLAWFGTALAIFLGALSERTEVIQKAWPPASYLLFPLSGAGFLVDVLPQKAQAIILMLPMVHGVEILREGYFGSAIHAHYDMVYMALINAILTLLGLANTRIISQTATPK
ncbi:ABC transporter permease [Rhodoferax sp.]|uniref:ABC transporter permease n=1 Tax=Rhodoferax sp. TaxID=50421 RepID=UPI0026175723|nr:ABC transporter permease [Rhodoferax sp.]MDD2926603.1 ABC transporter permease [Rhodoferax sp.]